MSIPPRLPPIDENRDAPDFIPVVQPQPIEVALQHFKEAHMANAAAGKKNEFCMRFAMLTDDTATLTQHLDTKTIEDSDRNDLILTALFSRKKKCIPLLLEHWKLPSSDETGHKHGEMPISNVEDEKRALFIAGCILRYKDDRKKYLRRAKELLENVNPLIRLALLELAPKLKAPEKQLIIIEAVLHAGPIPSLPPLLLERLLNISIGNPEIHKLLGFYATGKKVMSMASPTSSRDGNGQREVPLRRMREEEEGKVPEEVPELSEEIQRFKETFAQKESEARGKEFRIRQVVLINAFEELANLLNTNTIEYNDRKKLIITALACKNYYCACLLLQHWKLPASPGDGNELADITDEERARLAVGILKDNVRPEARIQTAKAMLEHANPELRGSIVKLALRINNLPIVEAVLRAGSIPDALKASMRNGDYPIINSSPAIGKLLSSSCCVVM